MMFPRAMVLVLMACGEPKDSLAGGRKNAEPAPASVAPAGSPAPSATEAPRSADIPEVVAKIGDQPITWNEVFQLSAGELVEAEIALYEARKQAVDGLVMQRLIEAEAAKQGSTPEALVQAEVAKIPPVTDAEVEQFYLQNQRQMQGTLDQMRPQIQGYLQQQATGVAVRALVDRLKAAANVQTFLPAYRLDVDAGSSPRKGPEAAPVQIVEFSDFQCPYCGQGADVLAKVVEKYGEKVSVVFKNFPLPMHPQAHRAAQAALCANDQEAFWKYHDALFADRKAWTDEDFKGYAKTSGLDVKKFTSCLEADTHKARVDADMEAGRQVGMGGTPGFYVNGIVLQGARPFEEFVEVIDAELARVN